MSHNPNDKSAEDDSSLDPSTLDGQEASSPNSDGTLNAFQDPGSHPQMPAPLTPIDEPAMTAQTADFSSIDEPPHAPVETLSVPTISLPPVDEEMAESQTRILPSLGATDLPPGAGTFEARTIEFDESTEASGRGKPERSGTDRGSGSGSGGQGVTGSSEKLHRVWDAAIGSASKHSGQSLRYERPEASDSVMGRVALRTVADANTEKSADADYQIQDKLGVGGMGIVFSAVQTAVNRKVALKTLKADKSKDASARKQFFYEAEITADLDHPNIPPIYEFGATADKVCFYTMKMIRGAEWEKTIPQKSQEENLEIFNNVADAIAFAHSKNILHRDIKPANVIVGAFGEVYVTDWGLAVNLSKIRDKRSIRFGGTPDYMAPEMGEAKGELIDKHCDIYLLGALLFEIIVGKPPRSFKKNTTVREMIRAVTSNEIRETNSEDPLLEVALKAMSTRPEDRYRTVEDLQAAVREIQRKNTNIKSSIELTKRSRDEARLAIAGKDYDRFNRAIFGFRDAMELWESNKDADTELKKVRLAYGQCAYERGDFDLAIQSLDRKIPDESALLSKAEKAKQAVRQREKRFRTLRNVFVAFLGLGILGASASAYVFNQQKLEAQRLKTIADDEKQKAIEARELEEAAKIAARAAQQKESIAKNDALAARDLAKMEKEAADKARLLEEQAKIAANQAREQEEAAKHEAEEQKTIAQKERDVARQRLAQVELGEQLAKLGFAGAQVDQFNPLGAAELLREIDNQVLSDVLQSRPPKLNNWAMNRVALLSNRDLPKRELSGAVAALDFALAKNLGIAGMSDGTAKVLKLEGNQIQEAAQTRLGAKVEAVAISPAGDEALLAILKSEQEASRQYQLYRWKLSGNAEPLPVEATGNRYFQGFAYNPAGNAVVAGIRGGLWGSVDGGNWDVIAKRVKGNLLDLAWVDGDSLLVVADLDGAHYLYFVQGAWSGDAKSCVVPAPANLDGQITAIERAGARILVGTDTGNLATWDLTIGTDSENLLAATLQNGSILPKRHRRAIRQIDSNGSDRLVTGSSEPTAHVWRIGSNGELEYETFLSGSPSPASEENNIDRAVFVDSNRVFNVDSQGVAIAVDIDRQAQRRRLTRRAEDGSAAAPYSETIVGIHPRGKTPEAISVDAQGIVDLWNLQDGQTHRLSGPQSEALRFSYFGHTPGADLIDTVVDESQEIIITSARVPQTSRSYLINADHECEFCVWDQRTGNMIKRWSDISRGGAEPRLSLVASGILMIASDSGTKIVDYNGHDIPELAALEKTSAAFAVTNPHYPELSAVFKRAGGGGVGWLWNRKTGQWYGEGNSVPFPSSAPIHAAWSSDGQRLYLLDGNGAIARLELAEGRLVRSEKSATPGMGLPSISSDKRNALRSFQDVDLATERIEGADRILLQIRDSKSSEPSSSLLTVIVRDDGSIDAAAPVDSPRLSWLLDNQSIQIQPETRVVAKRRSGNRWFVSMRSGNVYGSLPGSARPMVFGRKPLVASTADADGKLLITQHDDGTLLKLDLNDPTQAVWSKLPYQVSEQSLVRLSPDGRELAIWSPQEHSLRVVQTADGGQQRTVPDVAAFAWDPRQGASLVWVATDGNLLEENAEATRALERLDLGGDSIVGIHFFSEHWQNDELAPSPYVLIQSQPNDGDAQKVGTLWFVSRTADAAGKRSIFTKPIPRDLVWAVSPSDSILASGDSSGSIRIWFASPEFRILSPVYDLPSDGDAKIVQVVFSGDGETLLTSDNKHRLAGWMSRDPLAVPLSDGILERER